MLKEVRQNNSIVVLYDDEKDKYYSFTDKDWNGFYYSATESDKFGYTLEKNPNVVEICTVFNDYDFVGYAFGKMSVVIGEE